MGYQAMEIKGKGDRYFMFFLLLNNNALPLVLMQQAFDPTSRNSAYF